MWTKKKEVIDFKDYAESLDMPPCKDKQLHYTLKLNGARCYKCAAILQRKKELDDMDILADKIVKKLMEKQK